MKKMSEKQARRIIELVEALGGTRQQATDGLAYVLGAVETPPSKTKGSQEAGKQI